MPIDPGSSATAYAAEQGVASTIGRFYDGVDVVFKEVGIVVCATHQGVQTLHAVQVVVTSAADEEVVCKVALQEVVQLVAGGVYGGCAYQDQVFNIVPQGEGDGAFYCVRALVCQFGHHIQGVVNLVEVVALPALQGVCAQPAYEVVVACLTIQGVGAAVAGELVGQFVARGIDVVEFSKL